MYQEEQGNLQELTKKISVVNEKLKGIMKGGHQKEYYCVMGMTGVGKSSLICYLNGAKIIA